MLHRINFPVVILSAYLCMTSIASVQSPAITEAAKEQYLRVLNSLAAKNYSAAVSESQALIGLAPDYDHAYRRLVEASTKNNSLHLTKSYLESLLERNHHANYGLGLLHRELGEYDKAIESFRTCVDKHTEYAPAYRALADAYKSIERLDVAERYFKSAVEANPSSPAAQYGMACFYYRSEKPEEALIHIEKALELDLNFVDAHYLKATINYYNLSDYLKARDASESYLASANPNDVERRGSALIFRGAVAWKVADFNRAIEDINIALLYARKSKNKNQESAALGHLGSAYWRMDDYTKAGIVWRNALDVARETGSKFDEGRHLGNLGIAYQAVNELDKALDYFQQALELSKNVDPLNEATLLLNIGEVFLAQGKYPEAEKTLIEASNKAIAAKNLTNVCFSYIDLAYLYGETGKISEATRYAEKSLKSVDPEKDPWVGGNALIISGFTKLKNIQLSAAARAQGAIRNFNDALKIGESKRMPKIVWQARAGLAAAFEISGLMPEADNQYRQAIDAWESVREQIEEEQEKTSFLESKINLYQNRIRLLMAMHERNPDKGYDKEAFVTADRARARSFLDSLAVSLVNIEQGIDPALREKKHEITARIYHIQAQLDREQKIRRPDRSKIQKLDSEMTLAKEELRNWRSELKARHPQVAELLNPTPVKLPEFQGRLGEKSIFLEYSIGEPASFLFAVTKDGLKSVKLPAESKLTPQIKELLRDIRATNIGAFNNLCKNSWSLYQDLIRPVAANLTGKRELIIAADGLLHYVPFGALLLPLPPGAPKPAPKDLPYLIKKFAINYAPSANVLNSLTVLRSKSRQASMDLIAFAGPDYSTPLCSDLASAVGRLDPLEESLNEVKAIGKFFDQARIRIYSNNEANEENVLGNPDLGKSGVLHFSVHGHLDDKNPNLSGLVLSPSKSDAGSRPQSCDGLLQVNEVFGLKLNTDIVVLSSCETGLGKLMKGEGMVGLTRAFLYAGTPSIAVSLWKVEEKSTLVLMEKFYRNYAGQKRGKAESLTQAQRDMIDEGEHPSAWAGFVLVGVS